jgi:hypothetical protein
MDALFEGAESMNASVIYAAAGVLAIGSVWFFVRPLFARKDDDQSSSFSWQEQPERAVQVAKALPTHRAVSIRPGAVSCYGVNQHLEQRFLTGDALLLPLPECDQTNCECIYEHHDDRRSDCDRRINYGVISGFDPIQDKDDRRVRKDRREPRTSIGR